MRAKSASPQGPTLQGGVSLVELMVAIVIGLMLLGGVLQSYLGVKRTYQAQEALARLQENGRFAAEVLATELRRAGYWGGIRDFTAILGDPGRVEPHHPGTCDTGNDSWARMIAWPVFGLNDTSEGYACVANRLRGDVLTLRYAALDHLDPVDLDPDRLYVRSHLFSGRIMTGAGADLPINHLAPIGPDPVMVRELVARAYYVRNSGTTVCASTNAPVPALWRVGLDAAGRPSTVDELVAGVEQLQLRFLEAGTGEYRDAHAVTDWTDVAAVRVWVLLRAECPEPGLADSATYLMGDVAYAPRDDFRRQLVVDTVTLRNW